MLPPLNYIKSTVTVTNNYIFILYRRGELCSPVFVCYELAGDRRSPLRFVVVCAVSFATAFGCLSLTTQLLLFRKNHARLACSVVNALTTARCRYQLLRIYNCFQRKLSYINNNLTAAASHRPTMSSFQPKIIIFQFGFTKA